METILGVAIKKVDGTVLHLPAPNRHHHFFQSHDPSKRGAQQGFYSDLQEFISRSEGYLLAQENGQFNGEKVHIIGKLFSENLW